MVGARPNLLHLLCACLLHPVVLNHPRDAGAFSGATPVLGGLNGQQVKQSIVAVETERRRLACRGRLSQVAKCWDSSSRSSGNLSFITTMVHVGSPAQKRFDN